MKHRLLELSIDDLRQALAETRQPAFRAKQLADWVYRKGVFEPEKMTNLPGALLESFEIVTSRVVDTRITGDRTAKLLVEYPDGERVECVMIPTAARATACLSTQVGCAMECGFCATGQGGLRRNLSAGEILEQLLHLWQQAGKRITNVVFMGMGEPLANYEATVRAVRAIVDGERFNISARSVTVSTVGIPKQIRRLAGEDLPITLAISLHAPNDALRRQIVPLAAHYPLEEIIAAAQEFYSARRREITLEYCLIGGVNDTNVCAEMLAQIARRLRCNVNLIAYNRVPGVPYQAPTPAAVADFRDRLVRRGVNAVLRRPRGLGADAACGQLRQRRQEEDRR